MNKSVKYALLLGGGGLGAYLLYRHYADNGKLAQWFPSIFGPDHAALPTPGSGGAAGSGAGAGSGAKPPAGGSTPPAGGVNPPPGGGTPPPPAAHCTTDAQLCWDGTYVSRTGADCHFPPCATRPPAATGKTAAELAAEAAAAAKRQLFDQLVAAGVNGAIAQTYIDHCGTTGACDSAFLTEMYGLAALGEAVWMKLTDVGGVLFSADQWQYYRAAKGGAELDVGEIFADRGAPIHASEFVAALNSFAAGGGMSGAPARAWAA